MDHPIICFGQQPCGFFPKRFLFAKIVTARRLQKEIGGEIVFFCHDSDHDPRETATILRDQKTKDEVSLNFQFENRIQKQFSPLYAKRVLPKWHEKTARQLPSYVPQVLVEHFKETKSSNVADFCLEMYTRMGLLDGVRVERSSAPQFRARAAAVPDYLRSVSGNSRRRIRSGTNQPDSRHAFRLDAISDSVHPLRRRRERAGLHQQGGCSRGEIRQARRNFRLWQILHGGVMKSGPLKIGIACFPLIGGSGILATALGSELARRGHEVYFFSYAQPVRLDLPQDNLHFHRVDVANNPLFPSPDYTLPLAVKMAEVARSRQLDLFHVHYAVPHALAACLASQMLGPLAPRIVTTLHGTDTTLLGQDPDYRTAIEHALVHSDAVTAVSESLRNQTQEIFRLKRPIEVIPNFFTPNKPNRNREEVRRDLGITDEFLVLHMSSLRPVKRIDLLLRTIAMSKNRERIRLFILAGGPFDPYEPLLDELRLRDIVIVRQNTAVVDEYVRAADAGLYTSEYESFGLSILETMFYGKPVVAFRVGGIPEVIGDSCPLYPFGDVTAAAAGLDTLIESPDLARQLGERSRNRALEQFSADNILPRYEALYRRVIAGVG